MEKPPPRPILLASDECFSQTAALLEPSEKPDDKENEVKQIIVVRKDLKMRTGKAIAQGAHAAMIFLVDRIKNLDGFTEPQKEWLRGRFTKVCVYVNSEQELVDIYEKAQDASLETHIVLDSGKTEFKQPTYTCLAIGPDYSNRIDPVTRHLPLL